ncbi:hypothetical protein Pyn_35568 [Prunus yedoensis var. nudiflora]|uniref:Uncharacterized protein n=1 Tax=Prunus yedoensis var. nudiflora TaxID=2094558 RepID=A0A314XUL1_PRUYE|nr:hypothetical protein Pyn_35568 [Prunus yedoensis var. nudiflora]
MPVPAQEYVFGFQVPINDSQRVEVLEGDEDLGGEEADSREGEAVEGLAKEEVVEVAVGAVVDEEAGVVGDVDAGVECGEERVVEHGEDLGLGADVAELLGVRESLSTTLRAKVAASGYLGGRRGGGRGRHGLGFRCRGGGGA